MFDFQGHFDKLNGLYFFMSTENKMGSMPIIKLIFNMSLPIMFSMLIMALYNIVDSIFVGMIGPEALTAVSLAFPVQNLMTAFGVGTSVGVNSLVSLRLGQKRQDDVNKTAMNGIFLSIVTWLVFATLGTVVTELYVRSQTSNPLIIEYGKQYLDIILIFGLGPIVGIMLDRLLQSTGRTFLSMISQIVGAVFNCIFDPLLIFGIGPFPALGIRGAAIATVAGQIIGAVVSLWLNLKKNHDIKFYLKNIIPNGKIVGQIYKIAVPSILMTSITSAITYFMNLILGSTANGGDTAIAVYGVYFKLNSFIFMPVFGLCNGIVPIIAYNYGALHHRRITNTIRGALLIALCIMTLGVVLFELIPGPLFALFSATPEMKRMGIVALRVIAPSFFGAAIAITLSSVFQAFGNAVYSMLVSFSRQIIVFLPAAYLLSRTGNVDNVWWCFIIAEFMSVGMSLFFMRRIYVKKIKDIPMDEIK